MNGIGVPRRGSRPIRLTLGSELGGVIDGAWWPQSSQIAAELPDLVAALHEPLGEIVDIRVNWTASDAQLDLEWVASAPRPSGTIASYQRPRLMMVAGHRSCTTLLVIPSLTSQALGAIVVRAAAGLPTWGGNGDSKLFETAKTVLDVVRAESIRWSPAVTTVDP